MSVSYAGVTRPLKTIYIGPASHEVVLGAKLLGAPHMRQAAIPAMR